jgi:hypothetical protein
MDVRRVVLGVIAIALVSGAAWGAGTSAAHKPLGKMTCEDFLAVDDSFKPKLVYFGVAYAKGGSFWQKLKAEVKKIRQKL